MRYYIHGGAYRLVSLILVAVWLFVVVNVARASDDLEELTDIDVVTDINTGDVNVGPTNVTTGPTTMTGGDTNVSTGGNKAFAFSHSLGDVDINQCIVTKQTGTFIVSWQGYDYNLWCMGEVFDAKGLFRMGAEMRCDIEPIYSKFDLREDCLAANTVDQEITESPQLTALYNQAARFEEHEEIEEQHDDELERVQMEQAILMERLDSYEQRLEERPAPVIVQQEPRISEEQIEQAWQLIKGAKGEPQNE